MTKSKSLRIATFGGALALMLGLVPPAGLAQLQLPGFGAPTSGGLFGSSPAVLIGDASKALQEYCKKAGHLPQSAVETDEALKAVHTKLSGFEPSSSSQPTSEKQFRVLGHVMIATDTGLRNASIEQLRKSPPPSFNAPDGRVVIFITGEDQFLIWYSAADGKPAVDALGQAIILRQECSK